MKRLIFILLISLCGCQPPNGTGTGNPFRNGASSPSAGTVSGQIFFTTCQILEKCNPGMTDQVCGGGIMNLIGFAAKLGATDPSLTAEQIVSHEIDKTLIPDPIQGDKCMAQILKLDCSDQAVKEAYDPASPQPFEKTPNMLDPVCTGVFSH